MSLNDRLKEVDKRKAEKRKFIQKFVLRHAEHYQYYNDAIINKAASLWKDIVEKSNE